MGPFPHDAPPASIGPHNPAGTDGFQLVELADPEPGRLESLMAQMGFVEVARHLSRDVSLYRQGDIDLLVNRDPGSHAARFAAEHGPSAPSMAWRVVDAGHAVRRALEHGATAYAGSDTALDAPALVGIGGSLLYLVDRYGQKGSPYDGQYRWLGERDPRPAGAGFRYVDHLTHNVVRGNMSTWHRFYADVFGFRQIRFFNIEGKLTGLTSRALTSPCGKIRIPINESADDRSQIEEYLRAYRGEGIQHIALGTDDIYAAADTVAARGLTFMPPPPGTYYERSHARVRGHAEPVERMRQHGILIDGEGVVGSGKTAILLQVFTSTVVGPIFFELIQRKGDEGFGEGNFKALFESIEEDQIRRGALVA